MAIDPLHASGDAAQDLKVAGILEHLAACAPFSTECAKGRWSKRWARWATTANLIGLSLLPLFAIAVALRHEFGSSAGILDLPLLGMGLVGLPLIGLFSLLCTIASDALHLMEMHWHRGRIWAAGYTHDMTHVEGLLHFEQGDLRAADVWLEQKSKRAERRQARFFGGNDKLALLTLVAAGWAAWKEVQGLVIGTEPSWLLWGLAFLGGLTFGGLLVSRELERMAYLRDVVTLAIKRREAIALESSSAPNGK